MQQIMWHALQYAIFSVFVNWWMPLQRQYQMVRERTTERCSTMGADTLTSLATELSAHGVGIRSNGGQCFPLGG